MIYQNIQEGIFLSRSNRFIAKINIDGTIVIAHVKNTGRCKELLVSGTKVILQKTSNLDRKTKYDLIAVWKNGRLVNIDSQAPNKVFLEHLQTGLCIEDIAVIKSEVTHGNSRFDFYVETGQGKIFIEVKGVTLEEDGVVLFPDAPTERGVKHLNELAMCVEEGYQAMVVFVIQMNNVRYFMPNYKTHLAFGEALAAAKRKGVKIVAWDCRVTENSLKIDKTVPVKF